MTTRMPSSLADELDEAALNNPHLKTILIRASGRIRSLKAIIHQTETLHDRYVMAALTGIVANAEVATIHDSVDLARCVADIAIAARGEPDA